MLTSDDERSTVGRPGNHGAAGALAENRTDRHGTFMPYNWNQYSSLFGQILAEHSCQSLKHDPLQVPTLKSHKYTALRADPEKGEKQRKKSRLHFPTSSGAGRQRQAGSCRESRLIHSVGPRRFVAFGKSARWSSIMMVTKTTVRDLDVQPGD